MTLNDLGITLASEEQVLGEYSFSYSILLFFIKYNVYVTNKRFIANVPNVVLSILPLGKNVSTFPLKNIASIQSKTKFNIPLMFLAAILIAVGTKVLLSLLFGIIVGILSVPTIIEIVSSGASMFRASLAFWDKQNALQLINKVNGIIAEL